jgi:hypothetical protein
MIPPSYACFMFEQLRADSQVVRIYNDGLTGLLYDQGDEEVLREEAPSVLYGAGSDLFDDEATMSALRAGHLLVYGMHVDNGIDMEVIVGAPLTEAELARGDWLQAGPCHINLPSGRLCIHSYNSLPIGDCEPDSPGALVALPPGRYHARLYRKEMPALSDEESNALTGEDWQRMSDEAITDVLVLTPFAAGEPIPDVHNVLFGDCIDFEAEGASA